MPHAYAGGCVAPSHKISAERERERTNIHLGIMKEGLLLTDKRVRERERKIGLWSEGCKKVWYGMV